MSNIKIITLLSLVLVTLSACLGKNDDFAGAKKLVVSQPCLPIENNCEIFLEDNIKLSLKFKAPPSYQRLLPITLETNDTKLDNITISMLIDGKKMPSETMKPSENKKVWEAQLLPFATVTKDNLKLRLKITVKSKTYAAEFPVIY